MTERDGKVLVMGFGNPGRLDDGLGPALIERLEADPPTGATLDADYQLTVEDGQVVSRHDAVIFVDASTVAEGPFSFERLEPVAELSFSTHSVEPAAVLALSRDLFGRDVPGYILGIRGYEFNEFGQRLSDKAVENLDRAEAFLRQVLKDRTFDRSAAEPTSSSKT